MCCAATRRTTRIGCEVIVVNGFRTETPPSPVTVPPSDLHEHLADMLCSGNGADVKFPAHRCMLAARTPAICKELLHGPTSRVDGGRPHVFRYAYTEALPDVEGDMYRDLLVAADRFDMARLKAICEDKLCRRVDAVNVATMLALATRRARSFSATMPLQS